MSGDNRQQASPRWASTTACIGKLMLVLDTVFKPTSPPKRCLHFVFESWVLGEAGGMGLYRGIPIPGVVMGMEKRLERRVAGGVVLMRWAM